MVFEMTYNGDELYFETMDDAADIAEAFKSGHTVTLHFPADTDAPNGSYYAATDFYIQMSGYQPQTEYNEIVINPEMFMFSVLNSSNPNIPVNYGLGQFDYCYVAMPILRSYTEGAKLRFQIIGK